MPLTLPALTEKAFQSHVLALARMYQWRTFHVYDSRRSAPGFPDLLLCKPPVLLLAELKTDHGRLTPAQSEWVSVLGQCTTIATHLWRPADLPRIVEILTGRVMP